jgi:hypothetical protein
MPIVAGTGASIEPSPIAAEARKEPWTTVPAKCAERA